MKKKLVLCLLAAMCSTAALAGSAAAEESTTEVATEAADLSDDLYSFQLKINSDVYAFPMSYEEFTALGWEYLGDAASEIQPNSYSPAERFQKDGLEVYATIVNLGINTVPMSQASVAGISVDSFQMDDVSDVTIELPGGIQYGVSTMDDVTATYGTPSDTYEGDLYTKLTYEKDYYQDVDLYIDAETGLLNEIEVRNMVADEDANAAAAAEVSDEVTEEVLAYQTPSELGDDLTSFIVDYAGDLYQLPAPLSVFVENGWVVDEDSSTSVVAGKGFDWVYMSKDNQNFHTIVRNYNANATVIDNCFVTSVEGSVNSVNLPITIQKGLTIGLTEDEVVAALEGVDYELDDSSEHFHYYTVKSPESSLDRVDIVVDTEDNAVITIEVSNQPKTLN